MKSIIIIALLAVTIGFAIGCKNMEEGSDMAGIQQMKDSVFAQYPNVASIYVDVKERTDLVVVFGDAVLYQASDEKKTQIANSVGMMALRLFGKDNQLEKGRLIITKDAKNSTENPTDGIVEKINIDSLKKIVMPTSK